MVIPISIVLMKRIALEDDNSCVEVWCGSIDLVVKLSIVWCRNVDSLGLNLDAYNLTENTVLLKIVSMDCIQCPY